MPVTFTSNPPGAAILYNPWSCTAPIGSRSSYNHYLGFRTPITYYGNPDNWYDQFCGGAMPLAFELHGYQLHGFPRVTWQGNHFHADLVPIGTPVSRRSTSEPKNFAEEYLQDGILPNQPGFHIYEIFNNRYPYYLDAAVLGSPKWFVDQYGGNLDPNCTHHEACKTYEYVPPPGYTVFANERWQIRMGSGGFYPWCPPGETCGYPMSRIQLIKTDGTKCSATTFACAGITFEDLYSCQGTTWSLHQANSSICKPTGIPTNDALYWNLQASSVILTPDQISPGGTSVAEYTFTNSGVSAIPVGSFYVDILINGVVEYTSSPNPLKINPGQSEKLTGTISGLDTNGVYEICFVPRILLPS